MKKVLKYFRGIMPFFAALAIQYFIVILLGFVYSIAVAIQIGFNEGFADLTNSTKVSQSIMDAMSQEIIYLISVIGVIVCGIVFFFWYRIEIRGEVRGKLRELLTIKNVILLLILGMGCQFFLSGGMSLIQPLFSQLFEAYAENMGELVSGSNVAVLLLLILVAPVAEELVFRGVILHKTSKVIPFLGANILQALLFGIYHMNIIQGIYAAFMGLLLGAVYHKYKTIFAPILLHMIINTCALLVMLFPEQVLGYVIMVVAGGIMIITTLLVIKPFSITKKEPEDEITME